MQKGFKHSKETRAKLKISALRRDNSNRIAALPKKEEHWNWSKNPSILTLHRRIHRKYGSAKSKYCVRKCGRVAKDWALKEGKTYSDNIHDYEPLCRKCHIAQDKHWSKVDRSRHKIIRDLKGRIVTTKII